MRHTRKQKDIIEGRKIDPTFYPVIYGAEETDDWTDPKVWKKNDRWWMVVGAQTKELKGNVAIFESNDLKNGITGEICWILRWTGGICANVLM